MVIDKHYKIGVSAILGHCFFKAFGPKQYSQSLTQNVCFKNGF